MSALSKQVGGGHYKDMAIQPTEFCQKNRINFCESAVIKYVCRHGSKNGREDIEKAIHFLQMLLEIEYPEHEKTQMQNVPAQIAKEMARTPRENAREYVGNRGMLK
jgi:hypothetical protein